MKLKPGSSLRGIQPQTVFAMVVVDDVYKEVVGHGLTVTEGTGGVHKSGSLHYVGLAFDGRTNDVPPGKLDELLAAMKEALGETEFDVILEDVGTDNEHMHCEFQPKSLKKYGVSSDEALTGNNQGNLLKISVELRV